MITIKKALLDYVRPSEHSVYSPSASERWMACPASIKLSADIPNETSSYAKEGVLAHSVCEAVFRRDYFGIDFPPHINMQLAHLPDQGEEMLDCAHQFLDVVTAWLKRDDILGEVIWFGQEVGIPIFLEDECFGTADFLIIGTLGTVVLDFKYGKGKEVKKGSVQLKQYALGVMRNLENIPEDYMFFAVVHQPRMAVIPKVDDYTIADLEVLEDEVVTAIKRSKLDEEPVGGSHCFWCPAKRTKDPALKCPMIKQQAVDMANQNFNEFFKTMEAVRPTDSALVDPEKEAKRDKALIKIISLAPLLSKMAEDAKSELTFRLAQGEALQGVVLRDKEGRRRWVNDDIEDMAKRIKETFPKVEPVRMVQKLITITEVEKLVGKNKCDVLTVKPVSKELIVLDEKVQEILSAFAAFEETVTIE